MVLAVFPPAISSSGTATRHRRSVVEDRGLGGGGEEVVAGQKALEVVRNVHEGLLLAQLQEDGVGRLSTELTLICLSTDSEIKDV